MRIVVDHTTRYRFDKPATHGLQRLRLRPRDCAVQHVVEWSMSFEGARLETEYVDHNQNHTALISFGDGGGAGVGSGTQEVAITCRGIVDTRDAAGVLGHNTGFMPLWLLINQTEITKPGPAMKALAAKVSGEAAGEANAIELLHALSVAVGDAVAYEKGRTHAETTAEAALAAGHGVCQDHAHIFIGLSRMMGIPARYVSGYLLMDDITEQEASHGWAEAHVPGLGWVGFDVSNEICPDARYVRLAVGADYRDAAPITGLTQGGGTCELHVALQVAQQMVAQ